MPIAEPAMKLQRSANKNAETSSSANAETSQRSGSVRAKILRWRGYRPPTFVHHWIDNWFAHNSASQSFHAMKLCCSVYANCQGRLSCSGKVFHSLKLVGELVVYYLFLLAITGLYFLALTAEAGVKSVKIGVFHEYGLLWARIFHRRNVIQ